jgi:hypothetical protein
MTLDQLRKLLDKWSTKVAGDTIIYTINCELEAHTWDDLIPFYYKNSDTHGNGEFTGLRLLCDFQKAAANKEMLIWLLSKDDMGGE